MNPLEILDQKVQLHQSIEIMYMVTHYEARFYTTDGNTLIDCGIGGTIFGTGQN